MEKINKILKKILPKFIYIFFKKNYFYILFLKDYFTFKKLQTNNERFLIQWKNRYPQLYDKTNGTNFDRHYIYHPAWAARVVKKINPEFHTDISSSLAFCSMLSAFIPVKFYDYRPADLVLSNLESKKGDLLSLPFENNSVRSLSCMHTIEHIGLGRYGEPIDTEGDLKAIEELKRVVALDGSLIFVVPVGKPKIQFNAHRIYSYEQILSYFSNFKLEEFSLIPENFGPIITNAKKEHADRENYACGCFWFKKIK